MKRRGTILLIVLALLVAGLASCSPSSAGKPVKIVATDNQWDSQRIHNAIAKIVVEHGYEGYEFETSTAASNMNWLAIVDGEIDLDIESWTDNVLSYPDDVAKGDIVDVGVLVPDSRQGLYVPRYVIEGDPERGIEPMAPGLKTVKDLANYPEVFPDDEDPSKGRIYGGTPGYMADEVLYKKYQAYGLDKYYTYTRLGSESVIAASLVSAYNLGEAWVGYGYEPTLVTGKLDLVHLEDEPYDPETYFDGLCAYPAQELKIVSSKQFAKKAPDLLGFFQNYQTGSVQIAEALAYLDENQCTVEETAVWFLKENDALLSQWLPEENAAAVRSYLSGV